LGKYPEQSIHDVWFGSKIVKLRKYISHNDLSQGCNECARRLENHLFGLTGAYQYDYLAKANLNSYPAMLDFEISNICNLECVMCLGENSSAIRAKRDNLPPCQQHYDLHFVEQIREFAPHLKEARFSGGEPFLIPLYYQLWEMLLEVNPGIEISVLTNATVLNERIKKMLGKGNFRISVSFDSFHKATYEKIRRNADFDDAFGNLQFYHSYAKDKGYDLDLNVCPMPYNWKEIPSMIRYCNEKNILLNFHTVVFPPSESLWAAGSELLKEISAFMRTESIESNSEIAGRNLSTYEHFKEQITQWISKAVSFETNKAEWQHYDEASLVELLDETLPSDSNNMASEILTLLLASGCSEPERKTILINLLGFSPDLIVSEFLHNEPEKLLLRLKMFNYQTS
jgi:molybdenum cofactor biosynthesis enzyme MoaA